MQEIIDSVIGWASVLGPNKYLQASITVLGFILIGKIAENLITKGLGKLSEHSSSSLDDEIVQALRRPVFVSFTLIGLVIATRILDLPNTPTEITISVVRTIAIVIWYLFLSHAFIKILLVIAHKSDNPAFSRLVPLIETVARVVLIALVVYFIFLAWDINVAAWLTSAGIIGLALSFAAKDTLANLFAGVAIAADAPYKKGDFIVLEAGERGMVTQIGMRSTRILTRDDVEITVPNGVIGNGKIINEAGGPSTRHRIRIAVGVAYGSDIDKVIAALESVASGHEEVCANPAPRVRFREFGESSLNFELLCWIDRPVNRGRMLHELNCTVYKTFVAESIEIPFPQRDLHVRTMPTENA